MKPNNAKRPVFDASAVLALMQGEPGSDKLRKLQASAVVNAVNTAEVLAILVNRGVPAPIAQAAYEALHLETAPFDADLAVISARFVHQGVSLGDRCFMAAAHRHGSGWTSDRELGALSGNLPPSLHFFR